MATTTWLLTTYLIISITTTLSDTPETHCRRVDVNNTNSKIVYLLRLQWLPGQCIAIPSCTRSKVEDIRWTIHGLWAAKVCGGNHEFRNDVLTSKLTDQLNRYWIDIKNEDDNEAFWECEYKKHGCATDWKQLEYFTKAIQVYQQYNPGPRLNKAGITPGGSYSWKKFEKAFDSHVLLKCNEDNSINELEFCLDHEYKAIDCDEYENDSKACSKEKDIKYLTNKQQKSIKVKTRSIW